MHKSVSVYVCSQRGFNGYCCAFVQKENPSLLGMHRSKSKHELKLLEKIPENAEATVVLVGQLEIFFYHNSGKGKSTQTGKTNIRAKVLSRKIDLFSAPDLITNKEEPSGNSSSDGGEYSGYD